MFTTVHRQDNSFAIYESTCLGFLRATDKRIDCTTLGTGGLSYRKSRDLYGMTQAIVGVEVHASGHLEQEAIDYTREMVDSIPFIRDIIYPTRDGLYVDAVNQPADKVIFACRAFSAFVRYGYQTNVLIARELGLPPDRKTFAFLMLTAVTSYSDSNGGTYYKAFPMMCNEYSVFDFATFGKESLEQFLNAGESFYPWRQHTMQEQHGYFRDTDFEEDFELFGGVTRNVNPTDRKAYRFAKSRGMTMNRLFTLPIQQTPLFDEVVKTEWDLDRFGGFGFDFSTLKQWETRQEAFLFAYQDFCKE